MKCDVCQQEIYDEYPIILNIDGDMACSKTCKKKYENERDHFFNDIVHDEQRCINYILGKNV